MSCYSNILVNSLNLLGRCLQDISPVGRPAPKELAIDMEGVDLSREGRVATLQIVADSSATVWIIDITTLGDQAFNYTTPYNQCLRSVLQSAESVKLFYDVRNDSDALFSHYGVSVQNVYDVQLLDVASKRSNGTKVGSLIGLGKCIENTLQDINTEEWLRIKAAGVELFSPKKGGSYEVFEQRPINPILLQYCSQDVVLLFELKKALLKKLGCTDGYPSSWKRRVTTASANRAAESKKGNYKPHGKQKMIARHF